MQVFPKAFVLNTKSHFDVKRTYALIRGLVVKTVVLGKTSISAIKTITLRMLHLSSKILSIFEDFMRNKSDCNCGLAMRVKFVR